MVSKPIFRKIILFGKTMVSKAEDFFSKKTTNLRVLPDRDSPDQT